MSVLPVIKDEPSCTCDFCVDACSAKPGWFAPGEVDAVAKYLGMTPEQLFLEKLSIDWWGVDSDLPHTEVLSPAVVNGSPGDMFDEDPEGVCVFLKDRRCSIHEVKPWECRKAHHASKHEEPLHLSAARNWNNDAAKAEIERFKKVMHEC